MRRLPCIALLVTLAYGGATANAGDDAKKKSLARERALLAGNWEPHSSTADGKPADAAEQARGTLKLLPDGRLVRTEGKYVLAEGAYKLGPNRQIDLAYANGPDGGKPLLGIYEVKGDNLSLCLAADGEERPTRLSARKGSGHTLSTYRRGKSDAELASLEKELKALEGTWAPVSVVTGGKQVEPSESLKSRLVLRGDRFTLERDGNVVGKGTLRLALSRKPGSLVLDFALGRLFEAIYEVDGDRLRLCVSPTGLLATDFSSTADNGRTLLTYRRVPPKK